MRNRTRVAVGAGALTTALALTGALPTGGPGGPGGPGARPAAAAALTPFASCEALRRWYVERTLDQVGPWGWGRPMMVMTGRMDADAETGAARQATTPGASVANGPTGTNLQEAGVDEPDVAKTDGRIVVQLVQGRRVVVTDVTGAQARRLGTWRLPSDEYAEGLLLVGDHVLLTAAEPGMIAYATDRIMTDRIMPPGIPGGRDSTHLIDLDISDPSAPRLSGEQEWSGRTLSLRQYGDTVRLVTSTGLPDLPFVQPRSGRLTEPQATRRNREVVRASTIEDWLPTRTVDGVPAPAVECSDLLHPGDDSATGTDTLVVATVQPGRLDEVTTVGVTAAGGGVYASLDRLYVFATDWGFPGVPMPMGVPENGLRVPRRERTSTALHAFAVEGGTTRYLASGTVDGSVRDSWSLDEHDGRLRVALSWQGPDGGTQENGVAVLREDGDRLVRVGELRGLGVKEEIQSVRWFDDLAVLVTFRQVDPLYTVDLSDPTRPRELGALKIPGFSSYLHPIGGDRLLGLGTDATLAGESRGAQAALFDIGDPTDARQLGKVRFGRDSGLGVAADPHDFAWLPDQQVAITSLSRWSDSVSSDGGPEQGPAMAVIRVGEDGSLSVQKIPGPGGWAPRALPLGGGRVALAGDSVRIVDLG